MKAPLTKEQFTEVLYFIDEQSRKEDELNNFIKNTFSECGALFLFSDYETQLIKLLKIVMNDIYDDIDYFIYEQDMGRKADDYFITEASGTEIKNRTPEDLYDFLIKGHFTEG